MHSIGQPPKLEFTGDLLAARSSGSLNHALVLGGVEKAISNPVVGLLSTVGEGYADLRTSQVTGGVRAIARTPALALGAGIDWNITRGRGDLLFTYKSAIFRGGLLGSGTMLRVDWLPTREHTLAVGLDIPLNQPLAGRTRPRHIEAHLPHAEGPHFTTATQPVEMERALVHVEGDVNALRACSSIWSDESVREVRAARSCTDAGRDYDASLVRAFELATGAPAVARHARAVMLDQVILPYDTLLGRVKDPDGNIETFTQRAQTAFTRWLADSSNLAPAAQSAALAVNARWLASVERVHGTLMDQWKDSRFVWLPLRIALTPSDFSQQEQIDSLIGRAVGRPFTDDNAVTYLRSRDLPLEIAQSVFAARRYHVLWTHDVTSKRHATHDLDNVGYELIADAYFPALTAAVKRYDQTGVFPVYMIFLDQYFYEPRGGRLWMTILSDPLHASVKLPGENEDREAHLKARQQELQAAVASSARLQADARRLGMSWLSNVVSVHVNITDPSDFSYRSYQIIPGVPFGPDNLMRDHRKIVLYDLDEADPYRGAMLMMGTGVGEQFASATWEDRGVRVRGPATLEARAALRRVMRAHAFRESDIPVPLREVAPSSIASTHNSGDYVGRAIQVHNEVGWGAKKSSVVRAMLYDLVQPGTVIIVPDPQWVSPLWASMLAGAAARGARVNIIAPAAKNAPMPDATLLSLANDVLRRLLDIRGKLAQPMSGTGGELRIALFAAKAQINDPEGRRREIRAGVQANPWLRELFPFDSTALAALDASEARAAANPDNATDIAHDEIPREPKMHQKTQLIARPGAIAALVRQPGWYKPLADVVDVQAEETANITERLGSYELPAVDTAAARHSDQLLQGFQRSMSPADRKAVSFYFSVGTQNEDPRGMALDGEASVVTSGYPGAAGFVDLYYLMARSTWITDPADLDRLVPSKAGWLAKIARIIWPTM